MTFIDVYLHHFRISRGEWVDNGRSRVSISSLDVLLLGRALRCVVL